MKTIIFRERYWRSLSILSPESRLEAYDAIMEYVFTRKIEKINKISSEGLAAAVIDICKSIDEDYQRYLGSR